MESEDLDKTVLDLPQPDTVVTIEKPKVKRVLTEKQRAALEAGRQKRKEIEKQKKPIVIEEAEDVEKAPAANVIEKPKKPRTKCPHCDMEMALSSLRNHTVRFHSQQIEPEPIIEKEPEPEPEPEPEIKSRLQPKPTSLFLKKDRCGIFL